MPVLKKDTFNGLTSSSSLSDDTQAEEVRITMIRHDHRRVCDCALTDNGRTVQETYCDPVSARSMTRMAPTTEMTHHEYLLDSHTCAHNNHASYTLTKNTQVDIAFLISTMSQRIKDTILATNFVKTQHAKANSALEPSSNKLSTPLNVLVIGASKGIGAGVVYAYAEAGAANLILAARASSSQELGSVEKRSQELDPSVPTRCFNVDITSEESVAKLAKAVKHEFGKLDIVVLNSGYSGPVVLKVDEGEAQDFRDVFDVNVIGTYLVARHFLPLLIESNGAKTFIAVNSFAALVTSGHIANTAYCISKFAQARLVEYISEQYGAEGILAVAVHPGAVNTEMADKTTPESFRSCKFAIIYGNHITHTRRSYRRCELVRRVLCMAEPREEDLAQWSAFECQMGR